MLIVYLFISVRSVGDMDDSGDLEEGGRQAWVVRDWLRFASLLHLTFFIFSRSFSLYRRGGFVAFHSFVSCFGSSSLGSITGFIYKLLKAFSSVSVSGFLSNGLSASFYCFTGLELFHHEKV